MNKQAKEIAKEAMVIVGAALILGASGVCLLGTKWTLLSLLCVSLLQSLI